ncbi:hypothetical protein RUM43_003208 [Polyplax serrata]|uniref:Uncharacterized protein n=1 Tax=Polyplax serrata TaxID=468196 RepID=A0AAN8S9C6_POLSC
MNDKPGLKVAADLNAEVEKIVDEGEKFAQLTLPSTLCRKKSGKERFFAPRAGCRPKDHFEEPLTSPKSAGKSSLVSSGMSNLTRGKKETQDLPIFESREIHQTQQTTEYSNSFPISLAEPRPSGTRFTLQTHLSNLPAILSDG